MEILECVRNVSYCSVMTFKLQSSDTDKQSFKVFRDSDDIILYGNIFRA